MSEIYLIAAEAALHTGEDAGAYLDKLREHRIEGYTGDGSPVTIETVLDERRKELFAEGQIAFDFWRNGISVETALGTIAPDDFRTVLPLPKEEIDISKGKLVQNPGYGT